MFGSLRETQPVCQQKVPSGAASRTCSQFGCSGGSERLPTTRPARFITSPRVKSRWVVLKSLSSRVTLLKYVVKRSEFGTGSSVVSLSKSKLNLSSTSQFPRLSSTKFFIHSSFHPSLSPEAVVGQVVKELSKPKFHYRVQEPADGPCSEPD
jgi:hypothetical protein